VTREWEAAVLGGGIDDLQRLFASGADIDARDRHNQTALMLAAAAGRADIVAWLVEHGAALDHTAKYGLSALMLAVIRGHADVVHRLAAAGANLGVRGSGAPGFAEKTALDLAIDRNDLEIIEILRSSSGHLRPLRSRHFETAPSWTAARAWLTFQPREPEHTAGQCLQSIQIHVRDHKLRELSVDDRTLEAHYGAFVVTQARKGVDESRRLALAVSYGRAARDVRIAGCAGRAYEHGPEPLPDDIDGRSPSVVTWHDAEMFYLIASDEMSSDELIEIAASLYE
jgi:hypothetical protein